MGIQAVGFGDLSMDPVHLSGSGGDPQLKTLEQKLQKLHQESGSEPRRRKGERVRKADRTSQTEDRAVKKEETKGGR